MRALTLRRRASLLRALMEEEEGGGSVLANPSFWAPLEKDLFLQRGEGSATYARSTTATGQDWEGRIFSAMSGEARFHRVRRVQNWCLKSEDLTNATGGWTVTNCTSVIGATAPDGTATAWTVTATGAIAVLSRNNSPLPAGDFRNSIYIRRRVVTGAIHLIEPSGGFGVDISASIPVDGSWVRLASVIVTRGAGASFNGVRIANNGDSVDVWHPQLELVGGSNQNPSEYVSCGFLTAPYHGTNADGVKNFATQNGNTVAGNVVVEATGAALSAATMLGFVCEEARTNLVLQSENFATTWVANGTVSRSAAALRCGSVVLDLITDPNGASHDFYHQDITFTGDAVKAISLFFAQGTSAGSGIWLQDTTATADRLNAVITWANGIPTVTMAVGTLLGTDSLGNGVFRARLLTTAVTAANNNRLRISPATNVAHDPAATGNAYFGGVQAENGTFCTSYIPTTVATVTRTADTLFYIGSGNVNPAMGAAYVEATLPQGYALTQGIYLGTDAVAGGQAICKGSGSAVTTVTTFDGANSATKAGITDPTAGAPVKLVSVWGSGVLKVGQTNLALASSAFDGSMGDGTRISIASSGTGSVQSCGTVRNVRLWRYPLEDSLVAQL